MSARRWRDWPLAHKGLLAIAVPLALLVGALATLVPMERSTAEAEAEARRTLAVQSDIQAVHAQLAEAATGVRGYLLTGRDDFLLRYREVQTTLLITLGRLHEVVRDAEQQQRLARITPLVKQKLLGLDTLRLEGRVLPETTLIERMVAQKQLLDVLRDELDVMLQREQVLVAAAAETASTARVRTLAFVVLAGLTGVAAAMAAVWLFAADIISRVQHLRDEAQRLSRAEWLTDPSDSRDELGQLSQSLVEASRLLQQRADETQAARLAAERASAAKSEFLSRTSHELRTPLNAIIGFAELLTTGRDAATVGAAREVLHGGRHLQNLIDELLDLGGIESGAARLHAEAFVLAPVIAESLALCAAPAATCTVICDAAIALQADRQRVKQVLVNLVSNALKYGPPEGPVMVSAERENGEVRLSVADCGPGIAPEQRARLFTPFDRLGQERSGTHGAGLGLALSQKLVEAMGGTLGVDAREGGGSVFWCRLPAAEHADVQPAAADAVRVAYTDRPPAPAPDPSALRRVLCVEDHPGNRALLTALLARRRDAQPVLVETLAAALASARESPPALVLLDLHLPDGDGAKLIPALRAAQPGLPVIVLTADALPETRARLAALDATAFLTKPLDVAAFHRLLDTHLAGPAA